MNTSTSTSTNAKTKRRIAEALLSIGAVFSARTSRLYG